MRNQKPIPAEPPSAGGPERRRAVRIDSDRLPAGGQILVRSEDRQIALFRLHSGQLHAVDNQCPHEGYPLVKGTVKDCVLTCIWHNYKFRLDDGSCLMGDEAVRTYPVRESAGEIEVEIVEPPAGEEISRYTRSLLEGLGEYRMGQVARDMVRLLKLGMRPERIALMAARYDAKRSEFGTTHALPVAVDLLNFLERYPGLEAVFPLMQLFDLCGETHVRRPARPTPEPVDPGDDPVAAGDRFIGLVENEDSEASEALLRGALLRGWNRQVVEPWLYRACARHFLSFGHPLIYQVKIFDLLERVGWEGAIDLLSAHLVKIITSTREDLLPEWHWFRSCIAEVEPRFPAFHARQRDGSGSLDRDKLKELLLDGSREQAFHAITACLEKAIPLRAIVDVMSVAAAERILRFDVRIDADRGIQDGWLHVTHILTYVNALRHALDRCREPGLLRLVYFGARFINNARPLDLPEGERPEPGPESPSSSPEESMDRLSAALETKNAPEAAAALSGFLRAGGDPGKVRACCEDLALTTRLTRPIVVAHLIKMCAAAFEEHNFLERAGHPDSSRPLQALIRLAASPIRERWIDRYGHEAIRFIEQGKVPHTLT